jgi:hypothetical protein
VPINQLFSFKNHLKSIIIEEYRIDGANILAETLVNECSLDLERVHAFASNPNSSAKKAKKKRKKVKKLKDETDMHEPSSPVIASEAIHALENGIFDGK